MVATEVGGVIDPAANAVKRDKEALNLDSKRKFADKILRTVFK